MEYHRNNISLTITLQKKLFLSMQSLVYNDGRALRKFLKAPKLKEL
jgi:hypothetical protein